MPMQLARGGRIPKNKWFVIARHRRGILSRHKSKSGAKAEALRRFYRDGKTYEVCKIVIGRDGKLDYDIHLDTCRICYPR